MANLQSKIRELLTVSLVNQELKNFFLGKLDSMNEENLQKLLEILEKEQKMLQNALLPKKMKEVSDELNKKFAKEIELKSTQEEELEMKKLEDQINQL